MLLRGNDIFAFGKCDMLLRNVIFPASQEVIYSASLNVI